MAELITGRRTWLQRLLRHLLAEVVQMLGLRRVEVEVQAMLKAKRRQFRYARQRDVRQVEHVQVR